MRSLVRVLQDLDLGHLRIIAELWGLDLPPGKVDEVAPALATQMCDPRLAGEVAQSLPPASARALDYLIERGGRAPMAELNLRFGPIRPLGPGKRDREKAWRDPSGALEGLWFRGLLGMGFDQTPTGLQEFGFIPDDLQRRIPQVGASRSPAPPEAPDPALRFPAGDLVEDAATVLAAWRRSPLRGDRPSGEQAARLSRFLIYPQGLNLVVRLLKEIGALTRSPLRPVPEVVRRLLSGKPTEVAARLIRAWRESEHNDLADVPGLLAAGGRWPNPPRPSREAILGLVESAPAGSWIRIEAFVDWARERSPTFLRPGGDFDSWYLQEESTGRFLRGIEAWQSVEGGLLRNLLSGPMHWLGLIELGAEAGGERPDRFRRLESPELRPAPSGGARLSPDGRLFFPRGASLSERYQIARFAEWIGAEAGGFAYRLTPRALATAAGQKLDPRRLALLLEAATGSQIPENLNRGIERWAKSGGEAALEAATVLRLKDPAVLARLQADRGIGRYLQEVIGPTAVKVRPGDVEALLAAAARSGLLIDPPEGPR